MATSSACTDITSAGRPLRHWLSLALSGLVALSLSILSVVLLAVLAPRLESQLEVDNRVLAHAVAERVKVFLDKAAEAIHDVAIDVERDTDGEHRQIMLDTLVRSQRAVGCVFLLDEHLRIVTAGLPITEQPMRPDYLQLDFSGRRFVRDAHAGGAITWSDAYLSVRGKIVVAVAVPLGRHTMVGELDLEQISSFVRDIGSRDGTLPVIIDRQSQVVAHPDPQRSLRQESLGNHSLVRAAFAQPSVTSAAQFDGADYIASTERIEGPGWIAVVAQPTERARGLLNSVRYTLVVGTVLSIMLAIGVGLALASGISRHVGRFVERVRMVAGGNYEASAGFSASKTLEVNQLTDSLRHMAQVVVDRENDLRALNLDLEARIDARTGELQAAMRELEAFSYSVSHDLRAPLRGIDGWSAALAEDCSEHLDPAGRQYLTRIRGEAQHMGRLIEGMLTLSRVGRAELKPAHVDLSGMAAEIAARLAETEPARSIEFITAPGLTATGDQRLLEMLLTNLLDNAVKFTGKTPSPRIEFGAAETLLEETQQTVAAYFVRDNGAGFDMAYARKLFGAFQRMHKEDDFPGIGVGLATVQRIVLRHGGRIWATAATNVGACFHFTLNEPLTP